MSEFYLYALVLLSTITIWFMRREWKDGVERGQELGHFFGKFLPVTLAAAGVFFVARSATLPWPIAVLDSLYSSVRLFLADGTLVFTDAVFADAFWAQPALFGAISVLTLYQAVYYYLCALAFSATATTVILQFKTFMNYHKLRTIRQKNGEYIYVFNALNDRAISIAENISADCEKSGRSRRLIFCNVPIEAESDLLSRANALSDAILFSEGIEKVHLALSKKYCDCYDCQDLIASGEDPHVHYFLLSDDQALNLHQAIAISADACQVPRSAPQRRGFRRKSCIDNLLVSVFATGEAAGQVLSSLNDAKEGCRKTCVVRRLDPARVMAWGAVCAPENRLVTAEDPNRDLNVVVVGAGLYGTALMRTLIWYYQRKCGKITLHVVSLDDPEENLSATHMGLLRDRDDAEHERPLDADYNIVFHPKTDMFSKEFAKTFSALGDIDAVFLALGDDEHNVEGAHHLRMLYYRAHYKQVYEDPSKLACRFFAIVHSDKRAHNLKGADETISIIGNHSAVYRYEAIHDKRGEQKAMDNLSHRKQKVNYVSSEYDFLSSLAEGKHQELLKSLYPDYGSFSKEEKARLGNNRWNAYMRVQGYAAIDPEIDLDMRTALWEKANPEKKGEEAEKARRQRKWIPGKWHNSIVPFDQMGHLEQMNNLTKEEREREIAENENNAV